VVKSAAMGSIADSRSLRQIAKEVEAVNRGINNGTFNESQAASVIESLKKEWGEEKLASTPGGAKLLGKEAELQQYRVQRITEHAKSRGLDPDMYTWDDQNNTPTLNPRAVQEEQFKMVKRQAELDEVDRVWTNWRKDAEVDMNITSAQLRSLTPLYGKSGDPALGASINNLLKYQNAVRDRVTGGGARPSSSGVVSAPMPEYQSMDDFIAAMKAGRHPVGKPGKVAGTSWQAGPNGDIKRVVQ